MTDPHRGRRSMIQPGSAAQDPGGAPAVAELTGVTFDHPRSIEPLIASANAFDQADVRISWQTHPLETFEGASIQQLAERYDVVIFDHPFIGEVASSRCLLPLDELWTAQQLDAVDADTLGLSFASYQADGHLWAAPVDGAAQFSATRTDLAAAAGPLPASLSELPAWSGGGAELITPLNGTHLACTYLTIAASLAGGGAGSVTGSVAGSVTDSLAGTVTGTVAGSTETESPADGTPAFLDAPLMQTTIGLLSHLISAVHPDSLELDPIGVLELMSSTDRFVHSPYVFGYTPYAAPGFRDHRLQFGAPLPVTQAGTAAILGGAGLGISARCRHPELAARYAWWLTTPAVQATLFPTHLGQPASRSGWRQSVDDNLRSGFFSGTESTMATAFLRPRHAGFPEFQHAFGDLLTQFVVAPVRSGAPPEAVELHARSTALFHQLCPDADPALGMRFADSATTRSARPHERN